MTEDRTGTLAGMVSMVWNEVMLGTSANGVSQDLRFPVIFRAINTTYALFKGKGAF